MSNNLRMAASAFSAVLEKSDAPGSWTVREFMLDRNVSESTARRMIARLVREGRVKMVGRVRNVERWDGAMLPSAAYRWVGA